jgi:hypothetical protein
MRNLSRRRTLTQYPRDFHKMSLYVEDAANVQAISPRVGHTTIYKRGHRVTSLRQSLGLRKSLGLSIFCGAEARYSTWRSRYTPEAQQLGMGRRTSCRAAGRSAGRYAGRSAGRRSARRSAGGSALDAKAGGHVAVVLAVRGEVVAVEPVAACVIAADVAALRVGVEEAAPREVPRGAGPADALRLCGVRKRVSGDSGATSGAR